MHQKLYMYNSWIIITVMKSHLDFSSTGQNPKCHFQMSVCGCIHVCILTCVIFYFYIFSKTTYPVLMKLQCPSLKFLFQNITLWLLWVFLGIILEFQKRGTICRLLMSIVPSLIVIFCSFRSPLGPTTQW